MRSLSLRLGALLSLFVALLLPGGVFGQRGMADAEKVHDPSTIVVSEGVRRFLGTGPGILLMREDASGKWLREGRLFAEGQLPAWHNESVPGNRGYLWAPDVIPIGGKFLAYYSVSTFGKNVSAIGLAIGETMDPASPRWRWEDRGPVIASRSDDRFNAIDPAIFRDDADGSLWMAFGSFWEGIHLIELDAATGLRRDPARAPLRVASAPEIEAPFLHKHDGSYFLFLNWGKCCRGVESTYEIRVGRSRAVTGPYLDRDGTDLRARGGTLVLASEDRWIGPGDARIGREIIELPADIERLLESVEPSRHHARRRTDGNERHRELRDARLQREHLAVDARQRAGQAAVVCIKNCGGFRHDCRAASTHYVEAG